MPYEIKISIAGQWDAVALLPAGTSPIKEVKNIDIYDNKPYEISLLKDGTVIEGTRFFINHEEIDSNKTNTFEGYYGWIIISAELPDKTTVSTGYISVMPADKDVLEQIYKMIEYITNRSEEINFPEKVNDLFGISVEGSYTNFKTADLLNHIYEEYERNFRHFYNNSRARLSEVKSVGNAEKLKGFSSDTIRFILTNPQYLMKSQSGIKIKDEFFTPFKTLISSNKKSLDIYENQVVLGFLSHLIKWSKNVKDTSSFRDLFLSAKEKKKPEFKSGVEMSEKLKLTYDKYKTIFGNIDEAHVDVMPSLTHIFKNVSHYNNLYKYMRMFFKGGIISPSDENMVMWYLDTSSRIYEYYVFLKLDEQIENEGFTRDPITKVDTGILPPYFSYKKGNEMKYLYYQPFISSERYLSSEGIHMHRFSPSAFSGKDSTSAYTPDYIIKTVDETGAVTYEIADAKFSDFNTVRNYYMPPSIFKYLASVEAENGAKISGLTLYYCKGDKKEQAEHPTIKNPYVKIVPLF